MHSSAFLLATLVILTGCALAAKPELALACQTTECTCLPAQSAYPLKGEPAPVQWKSNGDAYCDEGFVLRRVEK
jgi:hypothetical protein